jgi:D-tyrosyl-tRNA(Tyr) deacylase
MVEEERKEVEDLRDLKEVLAKAKSKEGVYMFTVYPGGNESDDN